MMAKLVCASALLAVAGAAQGAAFAINACDAGVIAGGIGQPITWTGTPGGSYTDSRGGSGVFAPDADGAAQTIGGVFDNYFGMDTNGPTIAGDGDTSTTGDGYSSNAALGAVNPGSGATLSGFRANIAQGVWFSTSFVDSGGLHFNSQSIFIMNLTLRAGNGAPTTAGLFVNIRDSGTGSSGTLGAVQFGLGNASNNAGAWGQSYYLDWISRPVSAQDVNATFAGGTSYAIYLVAVPTPGAAGIAGLAGLVAFRRRRA